MSQILITFIIIFIRKKKDIMMMLSFFESVSFVTSAEQHVPLHNNIYIILHIMLFVTHLPFSFTLLVRQILRCMCGL